MDWWRDRFTGDEVRRLVVHANEGLIVGAGIIEGLSLADHPESIAILAGFAALAAGALSAAGANYQENSTEREALEAFLQEEARLRDLSPEEELAELAAIYVDKGLTPDLAMEVARQLPAHEALAEHAVEELGFSPDFMEDRPILAAALTGIAFAIGALIPIVAVAVTPDAWSTPTLIVSVLAGLAVTSVVAARSSRMSVWKTVRRTLFFGIAALGVSALIGLIG